jgi:hypothetical protein
MCRFKLKKQNDVDVQEQYQVRIWNRSAAYENLDDDDADINRAWESITEHIKAPATESRLVLF